MKSVPKLIRRFVCILLLSFVLLAVMNILFFVVYMLRQSPGTSPWKTAERVAEELHQEEVGEYVLSEEMENELAASDVWALMIANDTMQVVWQSENLPDSIPLSYQASDIVSLTRGYIDGYPTFTGESEDGVIVLGYPKESYWKHMWPSWDYRIIENLPRTLLTVLLLNILIILLIYVAANTGLLRSVKPIVEGIQKLAAGEAVCAKETGVLSELASSINQASEILQEQKEQLRRKETARANWIAGVSHDIRTPLSLVIGNAAKLEEDTRLTEEQQKKASVIVKQGTRIKNLVNDLNLASKLEYNMQPVHLEKENLVSIVRSVVVDYMNLGLNEAYPIEWETDEELTVCPILADKNLLKRAISNLIQNSMEHNEQGCSIHVRVEVEGRGYGITVADDGAGATEEQIEKLNHAPHYMVCDENVNEQRHGLGLLIVKQIMAAHHGEVIIGKSPYGGFAVELWLEGQH